MLEQIASHALILFSIIRLCAHYPLFSTQCFQPMAVITTTDFCRDAMGNTLLALCVYAACVYNENSCVYMCVHSARAMPRKRTEISGAMKRCICEFKDEESDFHP